jgi:hypothetical protein
MCSRRLRNAGDVGTIGTHDVNLVATGAIAAESDESFRQATTWDVRCSLR